MTQFALRMRPVLFLAFCLAFAPVPLRAEPVRISYSSWLMTPAWMAEERGLFKKRNLEDQLIYIPSSATSVQALLGGSLAVITPGSIGVVIATACGVPVVAVAASTRGTPFTHFTKPEITKPEDKCERYLHALRAI
jgi:ABC-type nitrate/sulfonate/bicarbonate transport system substrate-binding protein